MHYAEQPNPVKPMLSPFCKKCIIMKFDMPVISHIRQFPGIAGAISRATQALPGMDLFRRIIIFQSIRHEICCLSVLKAFSSPLGNQAIA